MFVSTIIQNCYYSNVCELFMNFIRKRISKLMCVCFKWWAFCKSIKHFSKKNPNVWEHQELIVRDDREFPKFPDSIIFPKGK